MNSPQKSKLANQVSSTERDNTDSNRQKIKKVPGRSSGIETTFTFPNGKFIRRKDGIFLSRSDGEDRICSYIRCDANITEIKSGLVSVRIKFRDFRDRLISEVVPRAEFNNVSRLVDRLSNVGFDIYNTQLTKLFLPELYKKEPPKMNIESVPSPGWHSIDGGQKLFVTNGETYAPENSLCNMALDDNVNVQLSSKGTLDDWKKYVALDCRGNSRLALMLCAAVAGPMLDLLGYHNIGVHVFGPSRAGKTTGLVVACSLYGGPEFLLLWNATDNALQAIAASRNDLALLLDEISQCEEKQVYAATYGLMNGTSKSRLSSEAKLKSGSKFQLVVISTGEHSLQEHLQQAGIKVKPGQIARLISIPLDPVHGMFSKLHEHSSKADFASALQKNANNYYGTAGPEFIRRLVDNQQHLRRTLPAQVSDIEEILIDTLNTDEMTDVQRSIARSIAVIAYAGELAIEYEIFPWVKGDSIKAAKACLKAWYRHELEAAIARDPEFAAIKQLFLDEHADFLPLEQYSKTQGTLGHTHVVDGNPVFLLSKGSFEYTICSEFGKAAGIKALRKRSLLVLDSRDCPTKQISIPNELAERVRIPRKLDTRSTANWTVGA